jgi:hypothetical protein
MMLVTTVYAQLRATKTGSVSTASDRAIFRVNPALLTVPESIDLRSTSPEPFAPPSRAYYVIPHGDGSVPSREELTAIAELTTHFVLSVKQPYIEDKGHITFVYPEKVDPKRGVLFRPELSGQVNLHLYVEGGHRYFIDFVVNSWDKGVYRVTAESGEYSEEDPHGTFSHVLAVLIAAGSGWTQVDLKQDSGTGFELHRVEVTSLETASLE